MKTIKLTDKHLTSLQNLHSTLEEFIAFIQNLSSEIPTEDLENYAETLNYILDNTESE